MLSFFLHVSLNSYMFLPIFSMGFKVGNFKAKDINIAGVKFHLGDCKWMVSDF